MSTSIRKSNAHTVECSSEEESPFGSGLVQFIDYALGILIRPIIVCQSQSVRGAASRVDGSRCWGPVEDSYRISYRNGSHNCKERAENKAIMHFVWLLRSKGT